MANNKKMLKEKLLDLDLYLNNEYLDKYCELIEKNITTQQIKRVTEKHHIIQRQWYKIHDLPVNNDKKNIVNLSHLDHCLAHYYLCMCTEGSLQYANEYALIKMTKIQSRFEFNEADFMKQAEQYQEIYDNFCRHQAELNREAVIKRGGHGWSLGKHCYTDGNIIIFSDECPEGFWPTGTAKGHHFSEESRNKLKRSAEQRVNNPEYQKKQKDGLREYFKNHSGSAAHKKWINNGIEETYIPVENSVPEGWTLGRLSFTEDFKEKQRQNMAGRIGITDGKNIRFVKTEEEIPDGWYRGRPPMTPEHIQNIKIGQQKNPYFTNRPKKESTNEKNNN